MNDIDSDGDETANFSKSLELQKSLNVDIDGDGRISGWESNLCRLCLIGALAIAFGDKAINLI